jgi:hypothetical protein
MKRISTLRKGRLIVSTFSLLLLTGFAAKINAQCRFPDPPFYKEDFGLGARPAASPLVGGESPDLIYQAPPGNMDPEKIYTVSPSSDLHSNPVAWHHIPDHTVNNANLPLAQQGRMMVINDRDPAGTVFTKTFPLASLGQGNVHSLSYYVVNLLTSATCHNPGNDPDIYMSIKVEYQLNNTWFALANTPVMQLASTPAATWVKQTVNFTTPAFVYQNIRFFINNANVGTCGNDFAIDDIAISKCAGNIILPLDLVNFKGNRGSAGIDINWLTANETNVASFIVERSVNGTEFYSLRSLSAVGTNDNSYDIIDAQPLPGRNYYRLKMIDKDGKYKYSQIISLNWEVKGSKVLVFPNPASDKVNIEIPQEWKSGAEVSLINFNGQELLKRKYQSTSVITLPLDGISKGIYMLKIADLRGGEVIMQKLSVSK